jgi:hypothetical protein
MATSAIDSGGLYADMGLREGIAVEIMASAAKFLHRLDQKRVISSVMGAVASQAIPGGRRVRPFLFHPFLDIRVTGEAQIRTFRQEQSPDL